MIYPGNLKSKLPNTEQSIFAIMSKLAAEHQAINLSQGFPDFDISGELVERVHYYMKAGFNQYAPMPGTDRLRQAISTKVLKDHGITYDPDSEINITAGATQALYTAISAFVRDEDEVIIFEPAYDAYAPAVRVNGGNVKFVQMDLPDYTINWSHVAKLMTNRTKMIIINTPHNPTGTLINEEDMTQLERITNNSDIVILSDEVYEHLIFDGLQHQSVCRFPELARRSLVVGSFGKTFHATGWKMGYVLAPENLMKEFRKVHQWVVFAVNTPIQMAIADLLQDDKNYRNLPAFFQQKRDFFLGLIKNSRFRPVPCKGTYFQCLDYSAVSDESDLDFARRLTIDHKIASIPLSPFYMNSRDDKILRFCFAKKDETLVQAAEILCKI
ncbi:MAG: aminotransferase class I/II-fold pyridoxal phosphate-dependent enzyme [Sphingobacteriia bacterium]|nr:aminotransferase class I/II-fold pyridoxal phosphate-dependent enzyme [Sphingobacteriia bacterium]